MSRRKKNGGAEYFDEDWSVVSNQRPRDQRDALERIKINLKCKTEKQKSLYNSIRESEITIVSGSAGTGKTYVACATALELLKSHETPYKKIIIVKSLTQLKGEETGFLKGDLKEKIAPVMESFISNFEKIISKRDLMDLQLSDRLIEKPLSFLRGASIDNAIIIVDEIQNVTLRNMRTMLSRIGENSKLVFLGDINQIDNMDAAKEKSLEKLPIILDGIDGIDFITFTDDDIVRNPIIKHIEANFKSYLEKGEK